MPFPAPHARHGVRPRLTPVARGVVWLAAAVAAALGLALLWLGGQIALAGGAFYDAAAGAPPLPEGKIYPRGTPDVSNVVGGDPSLGPAFIGAGNSGADRFGGTRTAEDDRFAATRRRAAPPRFPPDAP